MIDHAPKIDTMLRVEPAQVVTVWPRIAPYLEQANAYGGRKFAPHDWLVRLLAEICDLFVSPNLGSAALCEAQEYPRRRVYNIILFGGEGGHDWSTYQQVFEAAAIAKGCSCIEVYGRPGWRKLLGEHGYQLAHYVWRKELNDGR